MTSDTDQTEDRSKIWIERFDDSSSIQLQGSIHKDYSLVLNFVGSFRQELGRRLFSTIDWLIELFTPNEVTELDKEPGVPDSQITESEK